MPLLGGIADEIATREILCKIGDLGLSAMVESDLKSVGESSVAIINPRWVAPEILANLPYNVEADVYSLGLVFWEIKHRKIVFDDVEGLLGGEGAIFEMVQNGNRPPIQMDNSFDLICQRCWAPNPFHRPQSSSVLNDIRNIALERFPNLKWDFYSPPQKTEMSISQIERESRKVRSISKISQVLLPSMVLGFVDFHSNGDDSVEHNSVPTSLEITCGTVAGNIVWLGNRTGGIFTVELSHDHQFTTCVASDYWFNEGKSCIATLVHCPHRNLVWSATENGIIQVSEILILTLSLFNQKT
jgi:hypothetical protein